MSKRLGLVWFAVTCVLAAGMTASCGNSKKSEQPTSAEAGMAGGLVGSGGASPNAAAGNAGEGLAEGGVAAGGEAVGGSEAAGGDGGAGPVVVEALPLARACSKDSDCGSGLTCVSANDDFEGIEGSPAGGLCTKTCETDADCQALDQRAVCGSLTEAPLVSSYPTGDEPRVCLLGCGLGANAGMLKCEGRSDLACRPFAASDSVQCEDDKSCPSGSFCYRTRCRELACAPRCNADSECEAGRYCDPYSGLCTETDPDPVPLGLECNDLPDSPTCGGGNCLVLFDDGTRLKGMCTQSCTLGERCGEGQGACIVPRFSDYGAGDAGYCQPLCNCNSDCLNPKDLCYAWGDSYVEAFGSRGVCDLAEPGYETFDCSGGEGGAGGDGGAGGASSNEGGAGGSP